MVHLVPSGRMACLLLLFAALLLGGFRSARSWETIEAPAATEAATPLKLRGYEVNGTLTWLGEEDGTRAIIVVFLAPQCPISNSCIPLLNSIALTRHTRDLEIYGVYADAALSRAEAEKHRRDYALRFPVLLDATGDLRRQLGATHTPHAFLISPAGDILYQGAVDDRFAATGRKKLQATETYLHDALMAVLSGRSLATAEVPPVGCLLEDPPDASASGEVTFNRDVAPILHAHCAGCHRPGQSAPFPLLTCDDARRHALQIVEVTQSRQMPPWKPVAGFNHFKHERSLSETELKTLKTWAASGKPEGREADRPALPTFQEGWQLGAPDVVLKVPQPFAIPADGPDVYHHFVLPTGIAERRLISAIEFLPGNPRVVHHACFYLDNTRTARRLDAAYPGPGYGGSGGAGFLTQGTLRSWLPGMSARTLPAGTGRLMFEKSDLILEIHYQCSGKAETDQSTVGLHFAPSRTRQLVGELQLLNYRLDIPPGATRHEHTASYVLSNDATLFDCAPHMHFLGREVKVTATTPDGEVLPIIWIRDWDFHWQEQYEFRTPLRLTAGTRLDMVAWYDNSDGNPLNPNSPPIRVTWGEQSTDEMGVCYFQFTCDTMEDFVQLTRDHNQHRMSQMRAAQSAGAQQR